MAYRKRQWAKVIDLNKCLGCQECSVACKMWWTNREGGDQMWWAIVETRPGPGYPRDWEKRTARGELPGPEDYGAVPVLDYNRLQDNFGGKVPKLLPSPVPDFGPNWYEDVGAGKTPHDAWFFYLHLSCMHCTDPACVRACPSGAIYKREDGIVLINQSLCKGFKACIQACPYKRIFWNSALRFSEKCILCYPRLEEGKPPICVQACTGKAIFFGDLADPDSLVSKLVRKYKVALPLHPEYNTQPNIFYIPPVMTPAKGGTDRRPKAEIRIPHAELRHLFGPAVDRAAAALWEARDAAAQGRVSELIEILTGYPTFQL